MSLPREIIDIVVKDKSLKKYLNELISDFDKLDRKAKSFSVSTLGYMQQLALADKALNSASNGRKKNEVGKLFIEQQKLITEQIKRQNEALNRQSAIQESILRMREDLTRLKSDRVHKKVLDDLNQEFGIIGKINKQIKEKRVAMIGTQDLKQIGVYKKEMEELIKKRQMLLGQKEPGSAGASFGGLVRMGLGLSIGASLPTLAVQMASSLKQVALYSLEASSKMKMAFNTFRTMLGSQEKAYEMQQGIVELAKKTPFEVEGLTETVKTMLGFGIESEKVLDITKRLGDVSGGSMDRMKRLALAYSQVMALGKLEAQETNQFAEAGVNIMEALSKTTGKTRAELMKMRKDGKISGEMVEEAFKSLTDVGGKFYGLMEKNADTFTGQMSNLNDQIFILASNFGEKLEPAARGLVSVFSDMLQGVNDFLEVPISEKLEEEKDVVNNMITTVVALNDEYGVRSALLTDLSNLYPEYLKGLDLENISNEQLISQLERINKLYDAKINLQKARETKTEVQEDYVKAMERVKNEARSIKDKSLIPKINAAISRGDENALKNILAQQSSSFENYNPLGGNLTGALSSSSDQIASIQAYINAQKQLIKYTKEYNKAQSDVYNETYTIFDTTRQNNNELIKQNEELIRQEKAKGKNASAVRIETLEIKNKELLKETLEVEKKNTRDIEAELNKRIASVRQSMKQGVISKELGDIQISEFEKEINRILKNRDSGYKALKEGAENTPIQSDSERKSIERESRNLKEQAEKRLELQSQLEIDIDERLKKVRDDIEDLNTFESEERIKSKHKNDIEFEEKEIQKKIDKYVKMYVEAGGQEAEARIYANDKYAPLLRANREKHNLLELKELEDFKDRKIKVLRQIEEDILEAQIEASNSRMDENKKDFGLQRDNEELKFKKRNQDIGNKYAALRLRLENDMVGGLIDPKTYIEKTRELIDLEAQAYESSQNIRMNRFLEINANIIDKTNDEFKKLYDATNLEELTRQNEILAQLILQREKYGTPIGESKENLKREGRDKDIKERRKMLLSQLEELNKAVESTNKLKETGERDKDVLDKYYVSDEDLEKIKERAREIKYELSKINLEESENFAQDKDDKKARRQEKIDRWLDAYKSVYDGVTSYLKMINDEEINSLTKSIDLQKERLSAAERIADLGNAKYLEQERQRLSELEKMREKAYEKQKRLDTLSQISSIITAGAGLFNRNKGDNNDNDNRGAANIFNVLGNILGALPRFKDGTKYVDSQFAPHGEDTVLSFLDRGERVFDKGTNRAYKDTLDLIQDRKVSPIEAYRRISNLDTNNINRIVMQKTESNKMESLMHSNNQLLKKYLTKNNGKDNTVIVKVDIDREKRRLS